MTDSPLLLATRRFLTSCPASYDFPTGGNWPIPSDGELTFLEVLSSHRPKQRADLLPIADQLTIADSYSLVIYSVRMSVYSARLMEPTPLLTALPALVIDDNSVDWRDILMILSIIEDCASRLRLNASIVLEEVAKIASPVRSHTICDGYLSRAASMRTVHVMGFDTIEDQNGLQYVRRPWVV